MKWCWGGAGLNSFEKYLFDQWGLNSIALSRLAISFAMQSSKVSATWDQVEREFRNAFHEDRFPVNKVEKIVRYRDLCWKSNVNLEWSPGVQAQYAQKPHSVRNQALELYGVQLATYSEFKQYLHSKRHGLPSEALRGKFGKLDNLKNSNPKVLGQLLSIAAQDPNCNRLDLANLARLVQERKDLEQARRNRERALAFARFEEKLRQQQRQLETKQRMERNKSRLARSREESKLRSLDVRHIDFNPKTSEEIFRLFSRVKSGSLDPIEAIAEYKRDFLPDGVNVYALCAQYESVFRFSEENDHYYYQVISKMGHESSWALHEILMHSTLWFEQDIAKIHDPARRLRHVYEHFFSRADPHGLEVIIRKGNWSSVSGVDSKLESSFEARWQYLEELSSNPWIWNITVDEIASRIPYRLLGLYRAEAGDPWDSSSRW